MKDEKLKSLCHEYDRLQLVYGDPNLNSIYFGGQINDPDICFVFVNPTKRCIAAKKTWSGIKAPWIGTKNIWDLFYKINVIDSKIYDEIKNKKGSEWTEDFANIVYKNITEHNIYITNLAKCTQIDARALSDDIYISYLDLFIKEIEIINPKVIILFGNQVSSIVLDQKITVSTNRQKAYVLKNKYKCYAVYYPVGNGRFNIDKSIEDIKWIQNTLKDEVSK